MGKIKLKIPKNFFIILGFSIFAYTIYISGKSFLRFQRINQEINRIQAEVAELEEKNLQLKNLIVYFQSQSYKEKELRERLGYRKPGEKVIYILEKEEEQISQLKKEEEKKKTNWQLWIEYLFKN